MAGGIYKAAVGIHSIYEPGRPRRGERGEDRGHDRVRRQEVIHREAVIHISRSCPLNSEAARSTMLGVIFMHFGVAAEKANFQVDGDLPKKAEKGRAT